MKYSDAINLLVNGKAEECIKFFQEQKDYLEYAYALTMLGKLDTAKLILDSLDSVRADWLRKLIPIFNGYVESYPSYFQIRNFLEIDINMLFKYNQKDYIQHLMGAADIFQEINNESYKFFARVFLKNNLPEESKYYMDKSLNNYFNDVELHYLFAEYYLYMKDYVHAKYAVENCLNINPEYYPAKKTYSVLQNI